MVSVTEMLSLKLFESISHSSSSVVFCLRWVTFPVLSCVFTQPEGFSYFLLFALTERSTG